jgi:hypothetical protein
MTRQDDHAALENEFRRIGTTGYDAFRDLAELNGHQIADGESVNVSFDVTRTLRLVRSLPDGAGVEAFIAEFIKELAPRRPRPPKAGPGGPGA